MSWKCPCGERTTPNPLCDMCDGETHDENTGWGGYNNHYLGKTFNNESEEREYLEQLDEDKYGDESNNQW